MLKLQGKIRAVKVSALPSGMSRQVTFEIEGDAVLDDLHETMRQKSKLNILIEKQQISLAGVEVTKVPAGKG